MPSGGVRDEHVGTFLAAGVICRALQPAAGGHNGPPAALAVRSSSGDGENSAQTAPLPAR